jgi:hypothetical protein
MVTKIDNITRIPVIENTGVRVRLNESEVNQIVTTYLESLREVEKSPMSGAEITDFFELVQNAVTSKQNYEGIPSNKHILVVEDDPPEILDTAAITFYLSSRLPGSFSQGPAGPGKHREVTPHVRAIKDHPEAPSQKLVTMGRFYSNWITFNVYAITNKTAREQLLWFEKVMDIYNWYFLLYGFRVIETEVGKRERVKVGERVLTKYPITYMVRTDDTFHFSTQELKNIVLKVEILSD